MSTSTRKQGANRAPYQRPQLKRLGAAAELTAFTLMSGRKDGDMGGTKRTA